ncbi:MAG TPA: hypothetical protein VFW71_00680 [Actinomycetota bacterium]|nr:hypothetical protein [Actinomycetota bacterium]
MRRPILVAIFCALTMLLSAGAARAYFSGSGSGTGTASVGTMQAVTVAAYTGETLTSQLYPGGPAADVVLKVTNPNNFTVTVTSVTAGVGPITADGSHPACTTTGVTFTAPGTVNLAVPANTTGAVFHLPGAAAMSTASSNGCQGATFSIPVQITVHS